MRAWPAIVLAACLSTAFAQTEPESAQRFIAAYPDQLLKIEKGHLIWKDGTRMPVDHTRPTKNLSKQLADLSLKLQLLRAYPDPHANKPHPEPARDHDPGRIRFEAEGFIWGGRGVCSMAPCEVISTRTKVLRKH